MSSKRSEQPLEAYVWVWLPGAIEPVVAGRLETTGGVINFNYGKSYLDRDEAIALYLPELPLRGGQIGPLGASTMPGCIADAGPDAWGQRVVMRRLLGAGSSEDPDLLGPLTYLMHSSSNRIGALDFQLSPDHYESRNGENPSLEDLMQAARIVDEGLPLPPELDRALLHGSSVGGARPKALLADDDRSLIAKFSSSTDTYPIVKAEFVAMELARRVGIDAASVELQSVMGKDVLLVDRFDREQTAAGLARRLLVSALTILELSEMEARYASYADLAQVIRSRFVDAAETLRELFARITFNVLVGNTDDHARNHAAFWDGANLALTPAYDICPQGRSGGEASQAMIIGESGFRMSQLRGCVQAASSYLLSETAAREIIDRQLEAIESEWAEVCELAELTDSERSFFWQRQFLNPYALEGY